ncbi:MAG: hypothetical protein K6D97_01080 [Clostridia bacterium]|nr:hypothetical protein [Clostridia bacterium]
MGRKLNSLFRIIYVMIAVYAILGTYTFTFASLLSEMNADVQAFKNQGDPNIDTSEVTKKFEGLGQALTMVGTGVMVAVIAYMGIKYMTAGPDAQAKLKTQLIGVVVSGIVIFGAYHIWKLVLNVVKNF